MFVHQILLVQHGLRMFTVPWRIRMYGYVWYKLMLTWLFFLLMVDVAICIYIWHTYGSVMGIALPHDYVRWPPSPCLASVHCSTSRLVGSVMASSENRGYTPIAGWFLLGKIPSFEMDDDWLSLPPGELTIFASEVMAQSSSLIYPLFQWWFSMVMFV